jgi:hypothetical protein
MLEGSSTAIAGFLDWFYTDRIGELIENRVLIVVEMGEDHRFHRVAAEIGASADP